MSDTPPAGATPPGHAPSAAPQAQPQPIQEGAGPVEPAPPRAPKGRHRRLPAGWAAWLLVLVVAVGHLAVAIQTVGAGAVVPAIGQLRGADILDWIQTLLALFVRVDAAWDTSRLLALWMLVLMVTSVYTSLRAGMSLPHGVLTFVGYALTSAIILGVAIPAVWYVFGDFGPVAAEFVPPVAMTAVAVLSLRNIES